LINTRVLKRASDKGQGLGSTDALTQMSNTGNVQQLITSFCLWRSNAKVRRFYI